MPEYAEDDEHSVRQPTIDFLILQKRGDSASSHLPTSAKQTRPARRLVELGPDSFQANSWPNFGGVVFLVYKNDGRRAIMLILSRGKFQTRLPTAVFPRAGHEFSRVSLQTCDMATFFICAP